MPPDHTFESKIVSGYLRKQAVLLSLVDVSIKVCGLTKNASILNKDIEVLTKNRKYSTFRAGPDCDLRTGDGYYKAVKR